MAHLFKIIFLIMVLYLVAKVASPAIENWASSPGTLIQLSASSGYYPFWQYGYGYRYPYYRYMYPYLMNDTYESHLNFPQPYGTYKYY